jgi:hypothetical protein
VEESDLCLPQRETGVMLCMCLFPSSGDINRLMMMMMLCMYVFLNGGEFLPLTSGICLLRAVVTSATNSRNFHMIQSETMK